MTRSYYRAFFALKEDTPGYSAEGRLPQGRCVIEARGGYGRVTIYVQDLEPGVQYKVYLIKSGSDKSIAAYLGTIESSNRYRGETRFECDSNNPGGSGCPIEEFDAAAIAVRVNDHIHTPLIGYKNAPVNWKDNMLIIGDTDKTREQVKQPSTGQTAPPDAAKSAVPPEEAKSAILPEELKAEQDTEIPAPPEETITVAAEYDTPPAEEKNHFFNFFPLETQSVPEEEPVPDGSSEAHDPHKAFKTIIQRFNRELDELVGIASAPPAGYTPPSRNAAELPDSIDEIFTGNPRVSPYEAPDEGSQWTRLSLGELSLLPVERLDYEHNLIIAAAFYKHKHLIIGKASANSQKNYIIGLPDDYSPDDSQSYRRLGFHSFKCATGNVVPGARGYWLKEI